MASAASSLPEPFSPVIKTRPLLGATRRTCSRMRSTAGHSPTRPSAPSASRPPATAPEGAPPPFAGRRAPAPRRSRVTFTASRGLAGLVALVLEHAAQRAPDPGIVVDGEHGVLLTLGHRGAPLLQAKTAGA